MIAPSPATRLNWPAKLTGSSHLVQLLFHRSEEPLPCPAIEMAVVPALGTIATWNWSGNYAKLMLKGRCTLDALEAALAAIAAIRPIAQQLYTGDAAKPKRSKLAVELQPIQPRQVPAETITAHPAPPGLLGKKLRDAWRSPNGTWIAAEYATDGWVVSSVREDRPEDRPAITVPRHDCRSVVFSSDGARALVVGGWTIREVEVATLATLRQVVVPRTIRDTNGWTSVLYHPTAAERFVVGTETGVFIVATSGDAPAFAPCLDVERLVGSGDGRYVLACQTDPARGEMFELAGDELRSIGKLAKLGEVIVRGDRMFSRPSKAKVFEIVVR